MEQQEWVLKLIKEKSEAEDKASRYKSFFILSLIVCIIFGIELIGLTYFGVNIFSCNGRSVVNSDCGFDP